MGKEVACPSHLIDGHERALCPYMDSSIIASQVFNYLMSLTEIKIAAIYSVSNRGFLTSGLLMNLSAYFLTLPSYRFYRTLWAKRVLVKYWSDLLLSSILVNLPPQSWLLGCCRGLSMLCPRTKSHLSS